jgi:ferredoxin-NADP reductase
MKVCWFALLAIAASTFIWRNVFVPLWGRRRFEVTNIEPQTHETFTLTFEPRDHKPFPRNPGQFMFLKLKRPGRRSEIHPFTISASPSNENIVQATIKKSGNFTNTIDRTVPGDKAFIEGPFGKFSLVHYDARSFLFIAGGVGITPLMSMLRYLTETHDPRPVTLLYANKTADDIIFRKELEQLPSNVNVVHVLSRPDDSWQGPRGHIDPQIIEKYAADALSQAHVFLCGPPPMMTNITGLLKQLCVPADRIHFERFTV